MTRISRDAYGLKLAEAAALRADCTRRQVGAVIVAPDGSIVSTGYNGLAAGRPGCASTGACPRGQMAYPTEAPISVGSKDTLSPANSPDYASCGAEDDDGWLCTLGQHATPWHVAGDGYQVIAVWTDAPTQPANADYEATGCRAVHAEVNAILRGRGREGCNGATMYVTDEPCFHCSVVIEGAGIVRVVTPETPVVNEPLRRAAERARAVVHATAPSPSDAAGASTRNILDDKEKAAHKLLMARMMTPEQYGEEIVRIAEERRASPSDAAGAATPWRAESQEELLSRVLGLNPGPGQLSLAEVVQEARSASDAGTDSVVPATSSVTSGPLDPAVYDALVRFEAARRRRAELAEEHPGWRS